MKRWSWKTTLGGVALAFGLFLVTDYDPATESVWVKRVGQFLAMAGAALGGVAARDNDVTSEQAGAGKGEQK